MYTIKFLLATLFITLVVFPHIYAQSEEEEEEEAPEAAEEAPAAATPAEKPVSGFPSLDIGNNNNPLLQFQDRVNEWRQQAENWRKQVQDWGKQAAENAKGFLGKFTNGSFLPPALTTPT